MSQNKSFKETIAHLKKQKRIFNKTISRLKKQDELEDKIRFKKAKQIILQINEYNIINFLKTRFVNGINFNMCICNSFIQSNYNNCSYKYYNKLGKKIKSCLLKDLNLKIINEETYKKYNETYNSLLIIIKNFYNSNNFSNFNNYNDIINSLNKKLLIKERKYIKKYVKKNMPGIIYLLQERASCNINEPVYKIGKTRQDIKKRLAGYNKGSKLLLKINVNNNLDQIELNIIKSLKINFSQRKDYGNEYFEGDLIKIIKLIESEIY